MFGGGGSSSLKGQRLPDQEPVRISEGAHMWRYSGNRARVSGTVIWCSKIKEHKKKESVGSGKQSGAVTTYSYTVDIAISFGQAFGGVDGAGEIAAFLILKANGKTVYNSKKKKKGKQRYTSLGVSKGDAAHMPSSVIEAAKGAGKVSGFRNTVFIVINDLKLEDFGNGIPQIWDGILQPDTYPFTVGDAVRDVWLRCPNRTADELDVTGFTGKATIDADDLNNYPLGGMQFSGPVSPQYIIDTLELAFDGRHQVNQAVLRVFDRGDEHLIEIKEEHLGAHEGRGEALERPVDFRDRSDLSLPSEVNLNYLDIDQAFKRTGIRQVVDNAPTENVVELEMPLIFKREQARRIIRRRAFEPYRLRDEVEIPLPPDYLHTLENDIVHFPFEGQRYYCLVLNKDVGANWLVLLRTVVVDVRSVSAPILTSIAGSWLGDFQDTTDPLDPTDPGLDGGDDEYDPPNLKSALLNMPAVTDDEAQVCGLWLAHAAEDADAQWITATLYRSTKAGGKYKAIGGGSTGKENAIGHALTALPDSPAKSGYWDRANHVDVQFFEGSASTIDEEEVRSGLNWLAIGQGDNMEIIAYRDAEVLPTVVLQATDLIVIAPDIVQSALIDWAAAGAEVGKYIRIVGFENDENITIFRKIVAIPTAGDLQLEVTALTELTDESGSEGPWTFTQSGCFRLSFLLRGLRNTEDHASQHDVGDLVVGYESPGLTWLSHATAEVGKNRYFKDVPEGKLLGDVAPITFKSLAETLRPFSPVGLSAIRGISRAIPGGFEDTGIPASDTIWLRWLHRSRLTKGTPTDLELHELCKNEEWGKHGDRTKWRISFFSDEPMTVLEASVDMTAGYDHEVENHWVEYAYTHTLQTTHGVLGVPLWIKVQQIAKPPSGLGNPSFTFVD